MRVRSDKYSQALRALMHAKRHDLALAAGGPPQGKCCDCKRDIQADEIAVKCDKCNEFVGVCCIDIHDHVHSAMEKVVGEMVQ